MPAIGWFFLVGGICMLVAGSVTYLYARAFVQDASKAGGIVVEMVERRGDSGVMFAPVVAFSDAEGKEHKIYSTTSSYPPSYRVGEKVTVLYDPNSPDEGKLDAFFGLWLVPFILTVIGVTHSLIGVGLVYFGRRWRRTSNHAQLAAEACE